MVTAGHEFSLEQHLLDRLRFCGMERENISDLISIIASLKNKYGIQPFTVSASGSPVPVAITARYTLQSTMLNKLMNLLLDTPHRIPVRPYGYPRPTQFELVLAVGD